MSSIIASLAVLLLVISFVGWIIYSIFRDRKRGKSSCGCGCDSCPMSGKCHPDENSAGKEK